MAEAFIDLRALGATIETLIAVFDAVAGDPELEHSGDDELTGDEGDAAWTEYHTRGRSKLASGMQEPFDDHEDAEEDDPCAQCSEDEISTSYGLALSNVAGCDIGDPDAEHDGREPGGGY